MTHKQLVGGLLAATMLCAGNRVIAAPAPTPAAAALTTSPAVAQERANAVIEALDEIGGAFSGVKQGAIQAAKTPQEKAAVLDAQILQVQRVVDEGQRKLNALQPLPGDDDLTRATNQVLADGKAYGDRIEKIIAAMREVSLAIKTNDQPRLQRSLPVMTGGLVAMVEGQAIVYRSRKVFVEKDSSDDHQLEASACLYEGLGSLSKAALRVVPPEQTVNPIRAARDATRAATVKGRARLKLELADTAGLSAQEKKALADAGAIQAQIFDSMDESAAILDRSADRLERGDLSHLQTDIAELGAQEDRQQQLASQRFNAS